MSATTIGDLLKLAASLENPRDRASVLRFVLRIARVSDNSLPGAEEKLGALYEEAARGAQRPSHRLRMLSWARRYGRRVNLASAERAFLEELRGTASPDEMIEAIAAADVRCKHVPETGSLLLKLRHGWKEVADDDGEVNSAPLTLAGNVEGEFTMCSGGWAIAGRTRIGKPRPATNDDGALVLELQDGEVLTGVADGTGDSELGYRASRLALQALADALAARATLARAVEWASACVRADNLERRLDGMTTLVACVLCGDRADIVACGDPVYAMAFNGGSYSVSDSVYDHRTALGGEPLGQNITSSGRLVDTLLSVEDAAIIERSDVRGVILGSDGLLVGGGNWTEAVAAQTFLNRAGPRGGAEGLVARAEAAIVAGAKPDNVTVVVATRRERDSST